MRQWRFLATATAAALLVSTAARGQLYADFETSLGNFTCELYYRDAPRTVANFVALADGLQPWLDHRTFRRRTGVRFFDGVIFHRVVPGNFIQAGSPKGDGSDGAGYVIPDELRKHPDSGALLHTHETGALSMAKRDTPHSGGSQFFIAVSPQPGLDDWHTVFGKVSAGPGGSPTFAEGMAVVTAIANSPRDANEKPLVDVVIQRVTIRREGTEAQAFNATGWQLPAVVGPAPMSIGYTPPANGNAASLTLLIPVRQFRAYDYLHGENLVDWRRVLQTTIFDAAIPNGTLNATPEFQGHSRGFFQMIETDYSALVNATPPLSTTGSVRFKFTYPFSLDLTITRAAGGGGSWTTSSPQQASGILDYASYGWGVGDAGLFSPDMSLIFAGATTPVADGKPLTSLFPTMTFNAGSSTQGYFQGSGLTFEQEEVGGRGVFSILAP